MHTLPKTGLFTFQAKPLVGDLFLADINVQPEVNGELIVHNHYISIRVGYNHQIHLKHRRIIPFGGAPL